MALAAAQGIVIAQRYRLDRQIGVGGMGEVWAATHLGTRKAVALKFLKDEEADRDARRRLVREARAASAVKHPNVVQYHDILELEGGAPVLVMDLLEGESLGQRLRRERQLSLGDTAPILELVVSAVGSAHALGIIHRDLKPDNLFLVRLPDGKTDVRVLDFGIAKLTATEGDASSSSVITETGDMLGTPYYMAPEQAFGQRDIDHRADIWALGIILYECLAGHRPVRGGNLGQILRCILVDGIPPLAQVVPELPADVTEMVRRMLLNDRGARPSDLREVHDVLARYSGQQGPRFGEAQPLSHEVALPDAFAPTTPGRSARVVVTPGTDPLAKTSGARPRKRLLLPLVGIVVAAGAGVIALRPSATPVNALPPPVNAVAPPVSAVAPDLAPPSIAEPTPAPKARLKEDPPRRSKKPAPAAPPGEKEERLPGGVPEKPLF